MIPILGRLLILGSLLTATAGAVLGFVAGRTMSLDGLKWARRFAYLYAALIGLAGVLMEVALLKHDFSVSYVAQVGSRQVPVWVTIVSLWSSLEGSILFWGVVLGAYIAIATFLTRGRYPEYQPDAIGVWLATAAFFSFLIAGPANPFHTVPNPPLDGPGPNPLLQNHVLMAIHPPFLYLGYVGMTIPFGFACAALLKGRLGHAVLKPLRESLMLPWIFQSIAIMLGGWWAYEVLGWGGYWAWDPVENASLLPWLTATAALHSIMVVERRGILKGWTITLVQSTFLLVILGTFMTRSGVFNSVHSFTQSAIGPTILVFLAVALLFTIALLAFRIDKLEVEGRLEGAASREAMFLVNNLLFVLLTFTVLIGTVFPLIVEAVNGRQMSVGRPYFDSMVVPIGAVLLFLLGVGPALPWGRATGEQMKKALLPPLAGALFFTAIGYALGVRSVWSLLTLAFGGYATQVTIAQMFVPMLQRMRRGDSAGTAFVDGQLRRGRRRFGSYIVHAAVIVVIVAIAVSSSMRQTTELSFTKGQTQRASGYDLTFLGIEQKQEPHRLSTIARFNVARGGKNVTTLEPRMSQYQMMRDPIGSPDVHTTAVRDLYVSLANIDSSAQTTTITVYESPMVVWIWIGVIIMGLGGVFALIPPRSPRVILSGAKDLVGEKVAETA
ncbi:MAG TPA: cytochrome c-type biogenesis CcmF C-terminal domain-containing protein [Thermoanaerobaculia bacterium]|nr:cytochrome c-type biogenesis CcmF C-terminal domain-containing protein [Thermoanaerobaculia bacterium]